MDRGINYVIDPDLSLGRVLKMAQYYDTIESQLIEADMENRELKSKLQDIKDLLSTEYTKDQLLEIISR